MMTRATDFAFLHGGGQGSWVWNAVIAALDRQSDGDYGRALALDIPGCGVKRGRDTAAIGPDEAADELIADITAAGLRDVVLVGHSQAGSMMPRLAQRAPDLFSRLIYITCSAPLPGQNPITLMGDSRHGEHPDQVGWPLDPRRHPHTEQYPLMFCNDMAADQGAAFLARLGPDMWPMAVTLATDWRYDGLDHVPATYIACLQDGILPLAWQERFAERFGAERIVRLDAGHQAMNTRPQGLAEILLVEAARS
jgi:pimeloyl-ACP methyl ester carboxylesterase